MAASALQSEHYLIVAPRNHLLRMLPPLSPPLLLPHRRRRRSPAVRVSSGDGGSGEGFASAVEKRSVPEVVEEKGAERDGEVEVAGAPELRWPPWEGLAERYKLIGATSLAFVIYNMDKYRVIKSPIDVVECREGARSFLGRSEDGIYFAAIYDKH